MALVPSADGEFVLSGGVDGFVKLWNPAGEKQWEWDEGAVVSALFSAIDSFGRVYYFSKYYLYSSSHRLVGMCRKYKCFCGIGRRQNYVA
jgi:hypothetical protein